jgi:hypothetical protein
MNISGGRVIAGDDDCVNWEVMHPAETAKIVAMQTMKEIRAVSDGIIDHWKMPWQGRY